MGPSLLRAYLVAASYCVARSRDVISNGGSEITLSVSADGQLSNGRTLIQMRQGANKTRSVSADGQLSSGRALIEMRQAGNKSRFFPDWQKELREWYEKLHCQPDCNCWPNCLPSWEHRWSRPQNDVWSGKKGGQGGKKERSVCKNGSYVVQWIVGTGGYSYYGKDALPYDQKHFLNRVVRYLQGKCSDGTWLKSCGDKRSDSCKEKNWWTASTVDHPRCSPRYQEHTIDPPNGRWFEKVTVRTGAFVDQFEGRGGADTPEHVLQCKGDPRPPLWAITGYKLGCGRLVDSVKFRFSSYYAEGSENQCKVD